MLEYAKTILKKVSFDLKLFEKELKKALKNLVQDEVTELKNWCYTNFNVKYKPVLDKYFI